MSPEASLAEALEHAASALPADADAIRPANGDPSRLLEVLSTEAAARVLRWLLEQETHAGAELAEAWVEEDEAGAAALAAVVPEDLPKAARKALKRAFHRLRSRGVEIEPPAPSQHVAKLPPIEDALDAALVSSLDPRGTRLVYLVESHPSGGARLFEVMLDEERGVVECEVYSAGRSKVRGFLRQFAHRDRFPAVEAPRDSVRALVAQIAADQQSNRPLPRAFVEYRSRITGAPAGSRTPGQLVRDALTANDAGAGGAADVIERIRSGELGPWPVGAEALQTLAEKLGELAKSELVVSPSARREQADALLAEAASQVFAAPFGERTARRFEETAYVDWKSHREASARACLAAADAFRAPAQNDNEVARALLERVLDSVLSTLATADDDAPAEAEESPLLVKP